MIRILALGISLALLASSTEVKSADTVSTFTLDGLSFVSFGDQEVVLPDVGSTIRFRFGTPGANGSIPFTIQPGDVSIAPIPLPDGSGTLEYELVSPASGSLSETPEGKALAFVATVRATLERPEGVGSYDYAMPFTTENVVAVDAAGTQEIPVAGMRLVDGVWYGQIVGATTNKEHAFPKPGAAVYTVLSGSFDQIPAPAP